MIGMLSIQESPRVEVRPSIVRVGRLRRLQGNRHTRGVFIENGHCAVSKGNGIP
jgi:hypothetical protein